MKLYFKYVLDSNTKQLDCLISNMDCLISNNTHSTCVAKLAPDEKPPTVMEFASMDGTLGKELPEGGGGVVVKHPCDKETQ